MQEKWLSTFLWERWVQTVWVYFLTSLSWKIFTYHWIWLEVGLNTFNVFSFICHLTLKSFEINWSSLPFLVFLMTSLEKCVVSQTDFIDFKIIPYFNSAFFQNPSLLFAERRGEVQLLPLREIMIKYKKWLNWFLKKIQKAYCLLNTTSVDILCFRYISYTSSFDKSCK